MKLAHIAHYVKRRLFYGVTPTTQQMNSSLAGGMPSRTSPASPHLHIRTASRPGGRC